MRNLPAIRVVAFLAISACDTEPQAPEARTPSKWVGTYEVQAREYRFGKLQTDAPVSKLTFVIGDIPHLFIDPNVTSGLTGIGRVADLVISNTNEKLSILDPLSQPSNDGTGQPIYGEYSHNDNRFVLYASPATAEFIIIDYHSRKEAPDLNAVGDNGYSYRGPYTKISNRNHDCRDYQPPCTE